MSTRAKLLIGTGLIIILLISVLIYTWPVEHSDPIQLGPKTTVITQPLLPSGHPDYYQALNNLGRQRLGNKPNGLITLLDVLGHGYIDEDDRPILYRELGIEPPTEFSKRFVPIDIWLADYRRESFKNRNLPADFDEDLENDPFDYAYSINGEISRIFEPEFQQAFLRSYDDESYLDYDKYLSQPWTGQQKPLLALYLEEQQDCLRELSEILKRPDIFWPIVVKNPDADNMYSNYPLQDNNSIRELSHVLQLQATYAIGRGNTQEALHVIKLINQLSQYHLQVPNTSMKFMGSFLNNVVHDLMGVLLSCDQLTSDDLQSIEQLIPQLNFQANWVEGVDLGDRYEALNLVCYYARVNQTGKILDEKWERNWRNQPETCAYAFNSILEDVNQYFDQEVQNIRNIPNSSPVGFADEIDDRKQFEEYVEHCLKADYRLKPNKLDSTRYLNQSIHNICWSPRYASILNIQTAKVEQLQFLKLALEIRRYQLAHGKYPLKLTDLPATTHQLIPRHSQNKIAVGYLSTGQDFLLFSFGENEQNETILKGKTKPVDFLNNEAGDDRGHIFTSGFRPAYSEDFFNQPTPPITSELLPMELLPEMQLDGLMDEPLIDE